MTIPQNVPPTCHAGDRVGPTSFVDDAILIEKYNDEYTASFIPGLSTRGAISVHINANRQGNGGRNDHWMDFATNWCTSDNLKARRDCKYI